MSVPRQRLADADDLVRRGPDHFVGICHDLRQPAGAIMLLTDTALAEVGDDHAVRRRLRQIRCEATWLVTLVDASADGDGPRQLDVSSAVRDCAERVAAVTACAIGLDCDESVIVRASPVSLRRALTNVIENAARAAGPDGQVTVRVLQAERGTVVVEVDDSGPGFGHLPVVHGLGLGITRAELGRFGGRLEVSERGPSGTRVSLRLPGPALEATSGAGP